MASLLVLKPKDVKWLEPSFLPYACKYNTLDKLLRKEKTSDLLFKNLQTYPHEEKKGYYYKAFTDEEVKEDFMFSLIDNYASDFTNSEYQFYNYGFNKDSNGEVEIKVDSYLLFINTHPLYANDKKIEGGSVWAVNKESKIKFSLTSLISMMGKLSLNICQAKLKDGRPCSYQGKYLVNGGFYCGKHK